MNTTNTIDIKDAVKEILRDELAWAAENQSSVKDLKGYPEMQAGQWCLFHVGGDTPVRAKVFWEAVKVYQPYRLAPCGCIVRFADGEQYKIGLGQKNWSKANHCKF